MLSAGTSLYGQKDIAQTCVQIWLKTSAKIFMIISLKEKSKPDKLK